MTILPKFYAQSNRLTCFLYIALLSAVLQSCAYRFTNQAMTPPQGMKKIAVEAIYDTSQTVLPHEILWKEIQDAIARNGHIILTSQEEADGILRIHLKTAEIASSGYPESDSQEYDEPKVTETIKPPPTEYRPITKASSWTTKESITFAIDVELWNLHTKKIIKKGSYSASDTFTSLFSKTTQYQIQTHFLLYEEALKTAFKAQSKTISEKIVTDLLI